MHILVSRELWTIWILGRQNANNNPHKASTEKKRLTMYELPN